MKRWTIYATLVLLSASTAISCGGGGSGARTPGPAPSFLASFTPANSSPGNNTVSMAQAPGGGGDLVTLNVGVGGVNDVFAASFRVTYDTNLVSFDNWFAGSFLERSGNSVLYQVSALTPGVLDVGIGCAGCSTGINAGASPETIVQLVFRATKLGTSDIKFAAADLLDSTSPPGPISGLTWSGGTIVAQ